MTFEHRHFIAIYSLTQHFMCNERAAATMNKFNEPSPCPHTRVQRKTPYKKKHSLAPLIRFGCSRASLNDDDDVGKARRKCKNPWRIIMARPPPFNV